MLELGVGMVLGGLGALLYTIGPAKSENDFDESLRRERRNKEEFGIFAGRANQFEWAYRATYRHPVLMRLPGVLLLIAGTVLLVVGNL